MSKKSEKYYIHKVTKELVSIWDSIENKDSEHETLTFKLSKYIM